MVELTTDPSHRGGTVSLGEALPLGRAPHIGHRQHLCDMVDRGDVSVDQMKALVRNPKFLCKKCGRVAAREVNLCEPVPL